MRFLNPKHSILNSRKGFTLTELMVAVSVFTVAITIAIGAFVRALQTQRIANHLMSVNSNASLLIEQLAREIRTGISFAVSNDTGSTSCNGSNEFNVMSFTNSKSNRVFYKARNGQMLRQECAGQSCSGVFEPVNASDVAIQRLCFIVTQPRTSDPWRVTVVIKAGSPNPRLSANFVNIQTTVSGRILPGDLLAP